MLPELGHWLLFRTKIAGQVSQAAGLMGLVSTTTNKTKTPATKVKESLMKYGDPAPNTVT